ncbi:MAG: hypothetical protein WAX07_06185 [Candidatus Altiarchaeia archaeon]
MKKEEAGYIIAVIICVILLGIALTGTVNADLNDAGLDKSYFYDANDEPIVQIVVGEKGFASDKFAADDIAYALADLVYSPSNSSGGRVVVSTQSRAAIGDYVQDARSKSDADAVNFFGKANGLFFSGKKSYEKGDLTQYGGGCDTRVRNDGLLLKPTYKNVHCLFCNNLCLASGENPDHGMKEIISVDSTKARYYEAGIGSDNPESLRLALDKGALKYTIKAAFIPLKTITRDLDGTKEDEIDYEYRGKIVLFGEEYYVRDIKGADTIYLSKGRVLEGVTSEGFTAEYGGYKYKIDHLIYSAEYTVAGILLDVQKPDGTIVQVQVSKSANGAVDNLEFAGVYAEDVSSLSTASIIVYDDNASAVLEDGEDLVINGVTYDDWEVSFSVLDTCTGACTTDEYQDMDPDTKEALLNQVDISYTKALDDADALFAGDSFDFPRTFKFTFSGYLTSKYAVSETSGGENGNIKIEQGDEPYQLKASFTDSTGARYENVRLDEGPFKKNDLFLLNGIIYKFQGIVNLANGQKNIVLEPQPNGARKRTITSKWTGGDVTFRELALTDAYDDDDPGEYKNDKEITWDEKDVRFISGTNSGNTLGADLYYNTGEQEIILSSDKYLSINPAMVGTYSDFETDSNTLELSIVKEAGDALSVHDYNYSLDQNGDGDDDDVLVKFRNGDGDTVYIDYSDRDYDSNEEDEYQNGVFYVNAGKALASDEDTLLITPKGDDEYLLDWDSHSRLNSVELKHPIESVRASFFVGSPIRDIVSRTNITAADVGDTVSVGCCSFNVDEFISGSSDWRKAAGSSLVYGPDARSLVVSQDRADKNKNLIVVGGPQVNGLSAVASGELSSASDGFVVRKDGKALYVAGWDASDTAKAGEALIEWLKKNIRK